MLRTTTTIVFALLAPMIGCFPEEENDLLPDDPSAFESDEEQTREPPADEIPDLNWVTTSVLAGTQTWGEDAFGTPNFAPSAVGATWDSSAWGNGKDRTVQIFRRDPHDAMLAMRGYGSLHIQGNGIASVTGRAPRIYIQRTDEKKIWENVEVTYFAKVISQVEPPSHAGLKIGARSRHGIMPWDNCNGQTYYGVLRFDGPSAFAKELKHGSSTVGVSGPTVFDPHPENKWVGIKFLLRDRIDHDDVSMELVIHDGNEWKPTFSWLDSGEWVSSPVPGCNFGPDHMIRGAQPAIFARFDGVGRIDIRDFTIRTVEPVYDPALFADVPKSSLFSDAIAWAKTEGITKGCNPPNNTRFCPSDIVTRGQMASFFVRFLKLAPIDTDAFTDDDESVHERDINAIANAGITRGCNPPSNTEYCPTDAVTREQMATFLDRVLDLPETTTDYFTDDDGSIHEGAINRLAASGLTSGCGDSSFCPREGMTREQMVTFLYRAR